MIKFFNKANQRQDIDCEVIEAEDGEEALEKLKTENPSLILCDIGMPKMDGFEVLKKFSESHNEIFPYCFFAFLTGAPEERKHAFKKGAMGFVTKGEINYFTLVLQIRTWLKLADFERKQEIFAEQQSIIDGFDD